MNEQKKAITKVQSCVWPSLKLKELKMFPVQNID